MFLTERLADLLSKHNFITIGSWSDRLSPRRILSTDIIEFSNNIPDKMKMVEYIVEIVRKVDVILIVLIYRFPA